MVKRLKYFPPVIVDNAVTAVVGDTMEARGSRPDLMKRHHGFDNRFVDVSRRHRRRLQATESFAGAARTTNLGTGSDPEPLERT